MGRDRRRDDGDFLLNNRINYRDGGCAGRGCCAGLVLFYLVCGVGAAANVGIAALLLRDGLLGWGLAGATRGAADGGGGTTPSPPPWCGGCAEGWLAALAGLTALRLLLPPSRRCAPTRPITGCGRMICRAGYLDHPPMVALSSAPARCWPARRRSRAAARAAVAGAGSVLLARAAEDLFPGRRAGPWRRRCSTRRCWPASAR